MYMDLYVLIFSYGSWDDYHTIVHGVFSSNSLAEAAALKYRVDLENKSKEVCLLTSQELIDLDNFEHNEMPTSGELYDKYEHYISIEYSKQQLQEFNGHTIEPYVLDVV